MIDLKNTEIELKNIGKIVKDEYKGKLKSNNHIATGKLFDSIDYKLMNDTNGVKLYFTALDYYINIEEGQAPGQNKLNESFVKKIRKWMLAKNIPTKPGNIDYRIARKISKYGTKAKPYLREIKIGLIDYTKRIENAIIQDIKLYIKQKIKNGNSN